MGTSDSVATSVMRGVQLSLVGQTSCVGLGRALCSGGPVASPRPTPTSGCMSTVIAVGEHVVSPACNDGPSV